MSGEKTTGVHFDSHTNSTHFTNCCNTALTERDMRCPRCGARVEPTTERGRHEMAMKSMYGGGKR